MELQKIKINESWKQVLKDEFDKPYFNSLVEFLKTEKQNGEVIYPKGDFIFRAFDLTPFEKVKVVILGQDPYHGIGQAHGLCFSVPENIQCPPSLQNIFKELKSDLNIPIPASGNLEGWAKQGVLLLNALLTVRANQPASHHQKGWEQFTDAVIKTLSDKSDSLVFILWGKYAQQKSEWINQSKHLILTAAHPSPFSAYSGFFGCKHFSKTNDWLEKHLREKINWKLN